MRQLPSYYSHFFQKCFSCYLINFLLTKVSYFYMHKSPLLEVVLQQSKFSRILVMDSMYYFLINSTIFKRKQFSERGLFFERCIFQNLYLPQKYGNENIEDVRTFKEQIPSGIRNFVTQKYLPTKPNSLIRFQFLRMQNPSSPLHKYLHIFCNSIQGLGEFFPLLKENCSG